MVPTTMAGRHSYYSERTTPIVFAAMLWGNLWHGQQVQFVAKIWQLWLVSHLDHPGIYCYAPLMILWLISGHYQFDAFPIHIPGQKNVAADALSRNH